MIAFYALLVAALLLQVDARPQPRYGSLESQSKPLSWGQYAPFESLAPYAVPTGCVVSQVNLIERHGARYPTSGATERIMVGLNKLMNASEYLDSRLDFLSDYEYDLGKDDLVPFGAKQSRQSGRLHRKRYAHLFSKGREPFVRSDVSARVVDSASNWTSGFHAKNPPPISVIFSETNNTLDDSQCADAGSSDEQTAAFEAVFAPAIASRLNTWASGANLTASDIYDLMSLCPFDSVAKDTESPWCSVFDQSSDWASFEYVGDLDKYYGTGYGGYLGRVQGVGYVNELLARLTGTAVNDSTQTNSTLDASAETFPLDRTIYADFSHDNQMAAIYAAMGLFKQPSVEPLDLESPNKSRRWRANRLVPFSARMVVEKVLCGKDNVAHVRVLVNDEVQPLSFCSDGDMCTLEAFVESQAYSREGGQGEWEQCFL